MNSGQAAVVGTAFGRAGENFLLNSVQTALDRAKNEWPPTAWTDFCDNHPVDDLVGLTAHNASRYSDWLDEECRINDTFGDYTENWLERWKQRNPGL